MVYSSSGKALPWFHPHCTREQAEEMMRKDPNLHVIVRPSSLRNKLACTIRLDKDDIEHVLIANGEKGAARGWLVVEWMLQAIASSMLALITAIKSTRTSLFSTILCS